MEPYSPIARLIHYDGRWEADGHCIPSPLSSAIGGSSYEKTLHK